MFAIFLNYYPFQDHVTEPADVVDATIETVAAVADEDELDADAFAIWAAANRDDLITFVQNDIDHIEEC